MTTPRELIDAAEAKLLTTSSSGLWFSSHRSSPGSWQDAFSLLEQAKAALPAPPAPSGILWGHTMSVALTSSTRQREFQDMLESGGNCPRLDANTQNLSLARSLGFKHFSVIVGNFRSLPDLNALAAQAISIATAYPEAMIELGNELNFSSLTAQQMASIQLAVYPKIKAASPKTIVLLSSIGNGPNGLPWARDLAAAGCLPGKGFDWANYHGYAQDAAAYDRWQHCWTPDASGHSMQAYFGNPPFAITEFGLALSDVGGDEAKQAAAISNWMKLAKSMPLCKYAAVYALSDDAPGSGSGYGLRRKDLSHRPAWDAYRQAATS